MQFIRDNIFYVCLIGTVVVLAGIISFVDLSVSGTVDKRLVDRENVINRVNFLIRAKKVNKEVVEAEKIRVETVRKAIIDVVQNNVEWNRRNYSVLELETSDGRTVSAFPIDQRLYRDYSLIYVFTEKYDYEIKELVKRLNPTSPPNDLEIENETKQIELELLRKEERERKIREREAAESGEIVESTGVARSRTELRAILPAGVTRARTTGVTSDISKKAQQQAIDALTLKRAMEGSVYASLDEFDVVFPTAVATASDTKLWQAQLNLWITEDIVEAISQTNKKSLKEKEPDSSDSVMNSAVKRLVSIEINEEYVVSPGGTGLRSRSPARTRTSPRRSPAIPGRPTGYPAMTSAMPPGYTPGKPARVAAAGSSGPSAVSTGMGQLTQRICNQQYDVIHYSFTVIMSSRKLLELERALMARNYHTVLSVEMQEVPQVEDKYYYYGPEPVMEVTMYCELLLMTDWERGKYDSKNKKWFEKYQPLMPIDVLGDLDQAGVLRREDIDRLNDRI